MSTPTIGLALGSGGARGLAHIPLLEVFGELGLRPDIVAGASIGAIIGAPYCAGIPGKDLRDYLLSQTRDRARAMARLVDARAASIFDISRARAISSRLMARSCSTSYWPDGIPRDIRRASDPHCWSPRRISSAVRA